MTSRDPNEVSAAPSRTLTDKDITSERKYPRRSFLAAAGIAIAGAVAVTACGGDPDSKKKSPAPGDPDTPKSPAPKAEGAAAQQPGDTKQPPK
jgi:hypothetical protein